MRVQIDGNGSTMFPNNGRNLLAASLLAALGLGATPAAAIVLSVTDCSDPATLTSNTLRWAVAQANSNSSFNAIDVTACSSITLTQGELAISSFDMTLQGHTGPFASRTQINATNNERVFDHGGHGTIEVDYIRLYGAGNVPGPGGCVFSAGSVRLSYSDVNGCSATTGGGVYAVSGVQLTESSVFANFASADGGGVVVPSTNSAGFVHSYSSSIASNGASNCAGIQAYNIKMTGGQVYENTAQHQANLMSYGHGGGLCGASVTLSGTLVGKNTAPEQGAGIYGTTISLTDATVSGNKAGAAATAVGGLGGGIFGSSVDLVRSTIDNNYAKAAGAIYANTVSVTNSTISGNRQNNGANVTCGALTLQNSTVAFNYSVNDFAGIFVAASAQITSSILARDYVGSSIGADDLAIKTGASVTAAASLIMSSSQDTGSLTADPQLVPLANHGGLTRTHALLATSPAVNGGENPGVLPTDQRGSGFARVVGVKADIGAYERQINDDEIFYNGVDH